MVSQLFLSYCYSWQKADGGQCWREKTDPYGDLATYHQPVQFCRAEGVWAEPAQVRMMSVVGVWNSATILVIAPPSPLPQITQLLPPPHPPYLCFIVYWLFFFFPKQCMDLYYHSFPWIPLFCIWYLLEGHQSISKILFFCIFFNGSLSFDHGLKTVYFHMCFSLLISPHFITLGSVITEI